MQSRRVGPRESRWFHGLKVHQVVRCIDDLVGKLRELEKERNNANEFQLLESTVPTHAKYATFKRKSNGRYTGMLGINIGDRFKNWHDFTVVVQGQTIVEALESSISSANPSTTSSYSLLSPLNVLATLWPKRKRRCNEEGKQKYYHQVCLEQSNRFFVL